MSDADNSYPYNNGHYNMGFDHNPNPFRYNHLQQPLPNPTGFDLSFFHEAMEYNSLAASFDLPCTTSQAAYAVDGCTYSSNKDLGETAAENPPTTPNSSVSFLSSDAGLDEDSSKNMEDLQAQVCEDGDVKSKKVNEKKKREEKKRGTRFTFMTKSDVDNLEDGYRWRKYGQKAVKNSPFPRNYYKCTTQKCSVKKRIERSSEDPSVVMTTYEGKHNHHSAATLRDNAAMFPPSLLLQPQLPFPSFSQNLLFPTSTQYYNNSNFPYFTHPVSAHLEQPQLPADHYTSLPHIDSSFLHKQLP